jgi:RHS repeat-associated protein
LTIPRSWYYYENNIFAERNHLGSVTELLDADGGIAKTYRYDAFGNSTVTEPPGNWPGFTYTGREYHPRSGLYYYRARWYDPELGRFLTQDPIGHLGGVNLYAYVGNDPVGRTDPLGLLTWCEAGEKTKDVALFVWDWVVPMGLSSYATVQLAELHPLAVAVLPAMELGGAVYLSHIEQQYQKSRTDLMNMAGRAIEGGVDAEIIQAHLQGVPQHSDAAAEAARLYWTAGVSVATITARWKAGL